MVRAIERMLKAQNITYSKRDQTISVMLKGRYDIQYPIAILPHTDGMHTEVWMPPCTPIDESKVPGVCGVLERKFEGTVKFKYEPETHMPIAGSVLRIEALQLRNLVMVCDIALPLFQALTPGAVVDEHLWSLVFMDKSILPHA